MAMSGHGRLPCTGWKASGATPTTSMPFGGIVGDDKGSGLRSFTATARAGTWDESSFVSVGLLCGRREPDHSNSATRMTATATKGPHLRPRVLRRGMSGPDALIRKAFPLQLECVTRRGQTALDRSARSVHRSTSAGM